MYRSEIWRFILVQTHVLLIITQAMRSVMNNDKSPNAARWRRVS